VKRTANKIGCITKAVATLSFVLFVSAAFTFCAKKPLVTPTEVSPDQPLESGLPPDSKHINGYFYASNGSDFKNPGPQNRIQAFAVFSDPGASLTKNYDHYRDLRVIEANSTDGGNINVGGVSFNQYTLGINANSNTINNILYGYDISPDSAAPGGKNQWSMDGNGAFRRLQIEVPRGFPIFSNPPVFILNSGSDLTIDLSGFISNYDSVCVSLSFGVNPFSTYSMSKAVSGAETKLTISKDDLSFVTGVSYVYISLFAFNYSNMIVNGKVYMFEMSAKLKNRILYIVQKK
jgi:hypothetical protein